MTIAEVYKKYKDSPSFMRAMLTQDHRAYRILHVFWVAIESHATEVCEWKDAGEGDWDSNCHYRLDFNPVHEGYKFCPFCGRKIKEVKQQKETS